MTKGRLLWRFRKGSKSNPVLTKECGCKSLCYDGTIGRYCETHERERMEKEDTNVTKL